MNRFLEQAECNRRIVADNQMATENTLSMLQNTFNRDHIANMVFNLASSARELEKASEIIATKDSRINELEQIILSQSDSIKTEINHDDLVAANMHLVSRCVQLYRINRNLLECLEAMVLEFDGNEWQSDTQQIICAAKLFSYVARKGL